MTRQLYFSSSSRVWDSLEWISGIRECGYAGWEIVADGNYRFDQEDSTTRIREALDATGLPVTVHAPYSDLNLAAVNDHIWQESIRQVTRCLIVASEFTRRVTIHPGYLSPAGTLVPERAWQNQKEALRQIGAVAVEHGLLACLENMIGIREFLCQDPGEILGMTEGMEGIGITIDIGHAHTRGLVDAFLPHLSTASHLHIHDNHGLTDEHLPLGSGTIDWERVGQAVSNRYNGVIVVEGRSLAEARISRETYGRWFV